MNKLKIINNSFMQYNRIDAHNVDFEYNNTSVIKIWYQYNNNMDQTSILYDLENKKFIAGNVDRLFTKRQKKILYKQLNNFTRSIILHYINIINKNHFVYTDQDLVFIENLKNKLSIIEEGC